MQGCEGMLFENQSMDEINRYIETSEENINITLKGKFNGTLYIHNKHNISIDIHGENACFSGTRTVCRQCEQYRGNIYKLSLAEKEDIERLWINGQVFHMARYPNIARDNKTQVYCSMSEAEHRLNQAKNPDGHFCVACIAMNGAVMLIEFARRQTAVVSRNG